MMKTIVSALALSALLSGPAFAGGHSNSGSSATAVSQSSSNSNAANSNINRNTQRYQPGAIGLAGLAVDACHGSRSFGGGFPGGSLGIGWTTGDDTCRAAYLSQMLHVYGYRKQAVQLLVNEVPEVRKVFQPAQTAARGTTGRPIKQCNEWRGGVIGGVCNY